jgi:hypothetical protein
VDRPDAGESCQPSSNPLESRLLSQWCLRPQPLSVLVLLNTAPRRSPPTASRLQRLIYGSLIISGSDNFWALNGP